MAPIRQPTTREATTVTTTASLIAAKRQNLLNHINKSSRTKRPREESDRDFDVFNKARKTRITVEILSKQPVQTIKPLDSISTNPLPARVIAKPDNGSKTPPSDQDAPPDDKQSTVATHREKVINGIKHELDRLQPSATDSKPQGRKLRSQEATRFKSDLSAYFPDYDEVIGNDPKEQHLLNIGTPIVLVDSLPRPSEQNGLPPLASAPQSSGAAQNDTHYPIRRYGDALFQDLFDSQTVDFSFLETRHRGNSLGDPLPDSYYEPSHKKAERLERSIRNTERGRAQHEKDQIVRLLDGLQGHDWLRTMGVSGVTETRKKSFEPARAHFIKGCQAILEKFKLWSLEEKRRKQEKERALAEEAKAGEEDVEEDEEEQVEKEYESLTDGEETAVDHDEESDGDPPDYSDVDASIAKQLREEALARAKVKVKVKPAKGKRGRTRAGPSPASAPAPEAQTHHEFTSFFPKKHLRDAALNTNRRKGRTVMAWGRPVPEVPEKGFDLPEEYRDEDTLKSHARRKRLAKRGSKH